MKLSVKCNFNSLKRFQEKLEAYEPEKRDKFIRDVAKELAARLIAKAAARTPVKTGTLRRGWTAKTHSEAASGSGLGKNAVAYARSLPIVKKGNVYEIEVINPVNYATYVEYGHRNALPNIKKSWIEGRFFLTKSINELTTESPVILERKLRREMQDFFGR